MRQFLFIATALLCTSTVWAAAPTDTTATPSNHPTTAERHIGKGIQCNSCHGSGDKSRPVRKAACLTCHQSYEALAKRTEKDHPNPHFNHYGDRDCTTCHKGHQPSTLSCNQCHQFDLKTP